MEKQRTTENDKPNIKTFSGNVSEKQMPHKRKELSEAELIRRRKEGTKHRQEKLIETLEKIAAINNETMIIKIFNPCSACWCFFNTGL